MAAGEALSNLRQGPRINCTMPSNSHSHHEILLHVNWHCHANKPMIAPAIEPELHQFLKDYSQSQPGATLLAVGGTENHVHVVLQIDPDTAASQVIGKLKGASAHAMNQRFGPKTLYWQRGYGVVSFARRNLKAVLDYVARQKEHHAAGTTRAALERASEAEDPTEAR